MPSGRVTVAEIRKAGFTWPPREARLSERAVVDGDVIDLAATRESLVRDRDFFAGRLDDASTQKQRYGGDVDDYTDHFEEHSRAHQELILIRAIIELDAIAAKLRTP